MSRICPVTMERVLYAECTECDTKDCRKADKKKMNENAKSLTNVADLITYLSTLPADAKVYVGGADGYMHVMSDDKGNTLVSFDDNREIFF